MCINKELSCYGEEPYKKIIKEGIKCNEYVGCSASMGESNDYSFLRKNKRPREIMSL